MLIRAELLTPQLNLLSRPLYNGLFTLHGTIMIFLWVIPAQVGLANYLVPLMIGAQRYGVPQTQRDRVLVAAACWIATAVELIYPRWFCPGWLVVLPADKYPKCRRVSSSTVNPCG